MSKKGIFSIASGSQEAASSASANGDAIGGQNGSPFNTVSDEPAQNSPFAGASEQSPFQRNDSPPHQSGETGRGGIPERRPEGQTSSFGSASAEPDLATQEPAERTQAPAVENVFKVVPDNTGQAAAHAEAFQMNGFSQQGNEQSIEAAPAVSAVAVGEAVASPFQVANDVQHDYEAAKANLEPQQDFAAVPSQFKQAAVPAPAPSTPAPVQQQAQPAYTPQAAPPQQHAQAAPSSDAEDARGIQQLELRAIFGVDHVLDINEILQRARTLPGIRNVAVVGDQEAAALSNFRHAMETMGLGNSEQMKLNSSGGSVDFVTSGNTTLAVLLEGSYAPGVKETLIIVAREIGKLA